MPVANAIHAPDATAVTCERVIVERIVARRSPAFFVVRGSFDRDSRVVVLCRPPLGLARGQTVDVSGTISTLPSGERVILDPTITGYFDSHDRPLMPPPPFDTLRMIGLDPWLGARRLLAIPIAPAAPADPSGPVDSAPVTVEPIGLDRFDTIASLLSTPPAILTPIELSGKRVCEAGDGFIVIGDDSGGAAIKVYTRADARRDDRVVRLTGEFHTDSGAPVIYAGSGPAPYFDPQGYVGGVTLAHPGTVTAILHGVPAESGQAIVEATDDGAPLTGDDPNDDPYKYDWVQLHDNYWRPINININPPTTGLELTSNHASIDVCGDVQSAITAHVTVCGTSSLDGVDVTFTSPDPGVFSDDSTEKTVTTTGGGYATVYLKGNGTTGTAQVYAAAYPYGVYKSGTANVDIATDTLTLTANPVVGQVRQSVTVIANVKDAAGNNVVGRTVYFSQVGGNPPASGSDTTDGSGNADWSVSRSILGKVTVTAYEDMSCAVRVTSSVLDVWFYDTAPDDWPMFMHDARHTGMSKTWDVSGETLTPAWTAPVSVPTASTARDIYWSYPDGEDTVRHPNPAGGGYYGSWIFEHP